jgi:molybdopterin synthase sulfur carrier subunit
MNISIKYFGQLAEVTQQEEESVEFSKHSISDLVESLFVKYPDLKNKDFKVAQNNELVSADAKITGAEIALLPPFAGG